MMMDEDDDDDDDDRDMCETSECLQLSFKMLNIMHAEHILWAIPK